jgi:RNase P subunit RPR2
LHLPCYLGYFNTNYVIFKKVESFLKNYQRKNKNKKFKENMELSRKYFICENENSRLINYSTNMCRRGGQGIFFVFFSCSQCVPIKLPKCSQMWFPRCPTLLGAGCKEIANDSSWQKGKF